MDINIHIEEGHPPDSIRVTDWIALAYGAFAVLVFVVMNGVLFLMRGMHVSISAKNLPLLAMMSLASSIHISNVIVNEIFFVPHHYVALNLSSSNNIPPYTPPPSARFFDRTEADGELTIDEYEKLPKFICSIMYFWLEYFLGLTAFLACLGLRLFVLITAGAKDARTAILYWHQRRAIRFAFVAFFVLPMYTLCLYVTTRGVANMKQSDDLIYHGESNSWFKDMQVSQFSYNLTDTNPLPSVFSTSLCHTNIGYKIILIILLTIYTIVLFLMAKRLSGTTLDLGYTGATLDIVYFAVPVLVLTGVLHFFHTLTYWWGRFAFVILIISLHLFAFLRIALPGFCGVIQSLDQTPQDRMVFDMRKKYGFIVPHGKQKRGWSDSISNDNDNMIRNLLHLSAVDEKTPQRTHKERKRASHYHHNGTKFAMHLGLEDETSPDEDYSCQEDNEDDTENDCSGLNQYDDLLAEEYTSSFDGNVSSVYSSYGIQPMTDAQVILNFLHRSKRDRLEFYDYCYTNYEYTRRWIPPKSVFCVIDDQGRPAGKSGKLLTGSLVPISRIIACIQDLDTLLDQIRAMIIDNRPDLCSRITAITKGEVQNPQTELNGNSDKAAEPKYIGSSYVAQVTSLDSLLKSKVLNPSGTSATSRIQKKTSDRTCMCCWCSLVNCRSEREKTHSDLSNHRAKTDIEESQIEHIATEALVLDSEFCGLSQITEVEVRCIMRQANDIVERHFQRKKTEATPVRDVKMNSSVVNSTLTSTEVELIPPIYKLETVRFCIKWNPDNPDHLAKWDTKDVCVIRNWLQNVLIGSFWAQYQAAKQEHVIQSINEVRKDMLDVESTGFKGLETLMALAWEGLIEKSDLEAMFNFIKEEPSFASSFEDMPADVSLVSRNVFRDGDLYQRATAVASLLDDDRATAVAEKKIAYSKTPIEILMNGPPLMEGNEMEIVQYIEEYRETQRKTKRRKQAQKRKQYSLSGPTSDAEHDYTLNMDSNDPISDIQSDGTNTSDTIFMSMDEHETDENQSSDEWFQDSFLGIDEDVGFDTKTNPLEMNETHARRFWIKQWESSPQNAPIVFLVPGLFENTKMWLQNTLCCRQQTTPENRSSFPFRGWCSTGFCCCGRSYSLFTIDNEKGTDSVARYETDMYEDPSKVIASKLRNFDMGQKNSSHYASTDIEMENLSKRREFIHPMLISESEDEEGKKAKDEILRLYHQAKAKEPKGPKILKNGSILYSSFSEALFFFIIDVILFFAYKVARITTYLRRVWIEKICFCCCRPPNIPSKQNMAQHSRSNEKDNGNVVFVDINEFEVAP